MLPEITVAELSEKLKSEEEFILLDVREPHELNFAKLTDSRLDSTIYVLCHHGNRSGQVTAWLAQQGWKNVFNVRGGIDEYARRIDNSVGLY